MDNNSLQHTKKGEGTSNSKTPPKEVLKERGEGVARAGEKKHLLLNRATTAEGGEKAL